MRIRIKREKGEIVSVLIQADTSEDGVSLKNAVFAAAEKKDLSPAAIIAELERDYEVVPPDPSSR